MGRKKKDHPPTYIADNRGDNRVVSDSIYKAEKDKAIILDAIRQSNVSLSKACKLIGCSMQYILTLRKDKGFDNALRVARDEYHQNILKVVAEQCVSKSIREGNGRLALDYLRFRHNDEYGTTEKVSGDVMQHVQLYIPKNGTEKVIEHE